MLFPRMVEREALLANALVVSNTFTRSHAHSPVLGTSVQQTPHSPVLSHHDPWGDPSVPYLDPDLRSTSPGVNAGPTGTYGFPSNDILNTSDEAPRSNNFASNEIAEGNNLNENTNQEREKKKEGTTEHPNLTNNIQLDQRLNISYAKPDSPTRPLFLETSHIINAPDGNGPTTRSQRVAQNFGYTNPLLGVGGGWPLRSDVHHAAASSYFSSGSSSMMRYNDSYESAVSSVTQSRIGGGGAMHQVSSDGSMLGSPPGGSDSSFAYSRQRIFRSLLRQEGQEEQDYTWLHEVIHYFLNYIKISI